MRELIWVDSAQGLASAVAHASKHQSIALDAEMDSFFCYHTKLCLVQMTVEETDYLIDSLALDDLSTLNRVTEDPAIVKVFHAGENDVPYFRKHGVEFQNIFDTHIAAKLLELPTKSLGGLVERYFEVILPKDQSRADWRLRPLPEEQVEYARQDTLYLCRLGAILQQELVAGGIEEEACHHFRSLQSVRLRDKVFDAEGWGKIKGARELNALQRSILHELFAWRESLAESLDLAVFRVAPNGALLGLSCKKFHSAEQIAEWAKSPLMRKHAKALAEAMERGRRRGGLPFPELGRRKGEEWSAADEKLFEKLRQWRNQESEKRGVDPSRVFSNRELKKVARHKPQDSESLRALEGLEEWKIKQYGEALLALLAASR